MHILVIEWTASLLGLLGAGLLCTNTRYSGWGFVAFLISNGFWVQYALMTGAHGLLIMQFGFTITSLMGIYRWLIAKPAKDSPESVTQN